MRRATFVACCLAALFAAGCSDSPPAPSAPATTLASADNDAPTWQVGNWWRFKADWAPDGFTVVVTEETESEYVTSVDDPGVAFYDARFDISTLGPQRKHDLAGSQGPERVAFFRWPLTDGASWTTKWDGQDVTIAARDEGEGRFAFQARNATGIYAEYEYDAAVRWMREIRFFGPDGKVEASQRLQGYGSTFQGELASWTLEPVAREAGDLADIGFDGDLYEVSPNVTDVWVDLAIECTAGFGGVSTGPFPFATDPQGRGAGAGPASCPLSEAFQGSAGAPQATLVGEETWGWEINGGQGTAGTYRLEIMLRTLHLEAFPPAG